MNIVPFSKLKNITCIIAITAIGLLSAAPSYDGISKEEGFMLRRITEFWKDQDYETVKSEIKNFLSTHENSKFCDQLRGNYGDLEMQDERYESALRSYEAISHREVAKNFLLNKMQCYYELERYEELLAGGKPYLIQMSKEFLDRRDEYYFLMAEGYFRSALTMSDTDEKNTYLNKAMPLYEKILHSSFNDSTMFALAEIYRIQGANDKAQSFFLELADRHPERKEELLFHAAVAQAEFNKPLAIKTFSEIIYLDGSKRADATLNRLILFFQEEKYDKVIKSYEEVATQIEEEKKPTLEYIISRSFFATKAYTEANSHLNTFIASGKGTEDEKRNALLMQLSTAQFLKDEKTYKTVLSRLNSDFPRDSELPQAVFIHAMMLKELGRADEAETELTSLVANKKGIKNQELLLLEYGLVAYNNDNWGLARETLNNFIENHQESKHAPVAWKYLLSSSINLLKEGQEKKLNTYGSKEFLTDLNKIMDHKDILDKQEYEECLFLQGKLSYEIGDYDESLSVLDVFIRENGTSEHISEAHLLTALCHHKNDDASDLFCSHAEKALQLDPTLSKKGALHLELFNAYLTLSEKSDHRDTFTQKARDHLYTAISLGETDIKLENKLWLANAYLEDLNLDLQIYSVDGSVSVNDAAFFRCFSLFEEILVDKDTKKLLPIAGDKAFIEWEVLKYAKLLGRKEEITRKIGILKSLIEIQTKKKDWDFHAKEEALFELAKTYEVDGYNEGALETYSFLSKQKNSKRTFIQEYSKLSSLRLSFQKMPHDKRENYNPQVFNILSSLKDIQIQKNPSSEPLHLEAALEYAKIRGQITKDSNPHVKYLFFLGRIKEDFSNPNDPMTDNYMKSTNEDVDSKALFTQYMRFIDAESMRMESIIKSNDHHMAMSYELSQKAKQLLVTLQKEPTSVYLSVRIKESLELIGEGKYF